jgi:arginyl-tRNA synthetase
MSATVDPVETLEVVVRRAAEDALGSDCAGVDPQIRRSDRADLQADLALGLARRLKKAPREIAQSIAAAIPVGDASDFVDSVEVSGPGFLNFTLKAEWLAGAAARAADSERLGVGLAARTERVVIDYSHPNVAKEMHVGHLRSTVIGDALARVLEWRGHTVIRQNHIGDWGTPFGMLIEHFVDLGDVRAETEFAMGELGSFYRAARKKFDEDPTFADRSRKRVVALQGGDGPTLERWRMLIELSQRYFETVYAKLEVTLKPADVCGESFYNDRLGPLATELETSGYARRSEGALCVFPAGFKTKEDQPLPLIVRKTDGAFGYASTDLAAIRYRLKDLQATRILYVVGTPQSQHLAMVVAVAKDAGWLAPPARAEHVAFGSVLDTDKRMFKSRSGETVLLIDLVDAAIARAEAVVAAKAPDLDDQTRSAVAKMVGIGAIKYADLSSDRIKDYVFDLERMVSFDGNSAGYLQYAHARIRSIFRKAGDAGSVGPIRIVEPAERALAMELLGFGNAVGGVEETLQPHRLTGYLHALGVAFTAFYDECPILRSDVPAEVRASRLALAKLTAETLALGLGLLGISVPERM